MTTKHIIVAVVSLMLMTPSLAQDDNRDDDIALVSDETTWVDDSDTLTWENDSIEADSIALAEPDIPDLDFPPYNYGPESGDTGLVILILLGALLSFIGVCTGLYLLVAVMAQNRQRSVAAWILLSIFLTPLLALLLLLLVGNGGNRQPDQGYNKKE